MSEKMDALLSMQKDLEARISNMEENNDSTENVEFINVRKNFLFVVSNNIFVLILIYLIYSGCY